jgi:hypothetical protein
LIDVYQLLNSKLKYARNDEGATPLTPRNATPWKSWLPLLWDFALTPPFAMPCARTSLKPARAIVPNRAAALMQKPA